MRYELLADRKNIKSKGEKNPTPANVVAGTIDEE